MSTNGTGDPSSLYKLGKALYETSISHTSRVSPVNKRDRTDSLKQMIEPPEAQRKKTGTTTTKVDLQDIPPPREKSNPRRWSKAEDDALRTAVERSGERNWKAIADQVAGRNHTQCLQRWTKVLKPGLIKGHWTASEDKKLRELVAQERKNWGQVALQIPGRTSKQCRERWCNHLDPDINKGAYTSHEDKTILEMQAKMGNRWSLISQSLPGRTEDAVKIRWKSLMRSQRSKEKELMKQGRKSPASARKKRNSTVAVPQTARANPSNAARRRNSVPARPSVQLSQISPPRTAWDDASAPVSAPIPKVEHVLGARPVSQSLSKHKQPPSLVTPREEWGVSDRPRRPNLGVESGQTAELIQQQRLRLLMMEKEKGKIIPSSTASVLSPGQVLLTKQLEAAQERQQKQVSMENGWKTVAAMSQKTESPGRPTAAEQQHFDGFLDKLLPVGPTENFIGADGRINFQSINSSKSL